MFVANKYIAAFSTWTNSLLTNEDWMGRCRWNHAGLRASLSPNIDDYRLRLKYWLQGPKAMTPSRSVLGFLAFPALPRYPHRGRAGKAWACACQPYSLAVATVRARPWLLWIGAPLCEASPGPLLDLGRPGRIRASLKFLRWAVQPQTCLNVLFRYSETAR